MLIYAIKAFAQIFVSGFLMVGIPQALLGQSLLSLGWNEILIINWIAAFYVIYGLVNLDGLERPIHLLKFSLVMCFWFLFVDWKKIFGPKEHL